MTILDEIIAHKRIEVDIRKQTVTIDELKAYPAYIRKVPSFSKFLTLPTRNGIIAEYKRKSPSKGMINDVNTVHEVTSLYEKAGVSAISVLTDSKFFGGTLYDLVRATEVVTIPVLRKEFIIDEYQIYESKALGASLILLIAAVLSTDEIDRFAKLAREIGLEVLLEIHDESELEKISDYVNAVGVNNRDLKTFKIDMEQSIRLADKIPSKFLKVSESGISNPKAISKLRSHGFVGFLIGENFMKESDPGNACIRFVNEMKMN